MKIKKFLITLFTSILIIGILCGLNGKSYSATGNLELSIEMLRKSGYGYKAFEKNIWKIVSEDDKYKYDSTIYCLKAGPGFGSSDMGTAVSGISSVVYTQYFDMKRKDEIPSEYLEVLPDNESDYNAVLWILDHAYIAPKTNASSDEKNYAQAFRNDLLTSAGISLSSPISDDEIDAVQQAAIWYFTNSDSDIYHQRNISMWANRQANSDADYTSLENVFGRDMGADKEEAISYLYDYLITEAEKAGRDYDSTSGNSPISLVKNQAKIVVEDGKLISGPYMIKQENNDLCALATSVTDKEGNQISDSSILIEQDGNKVPTSTPLNRLLNQEFYISVPQSSTSSIKLEIRVQYFNTSATFWSVANPDSRRDQPVVIIDRIMDEYSDSDVKEYTEKNFDLALRKYIYSIDGVKPTVDREPQVNTDNLKQGKTTAEKVHTKDPLIVRTGSKVIYRISIYNEGNVDGYATEITDYLPEGLKLAENSQINNDNGWVSSADGKTVTTTKLKDTLISKYDGGDTLSKIELEIECEVTAVSKIDSQTLKNVAEITKQKDIDDNETDIDSIPGNLTEEEKSEYNPGESEKGWGYEDDDDYEDLILPGQSLDLALRKFIIQIADTELKTGNRYDREPNIDLTELKNGTKTTAEYRHTKESISVSIGDEVIYMIRVYNEGKLDGYASEITDYLPPELEFIENDSLNKSYGWVLQSDGRTIKTTALAKNGILDLERNTEGAMLHAFDGNTLDYKELKVKCRVKGSVIISGQEQSVRTGKNITNIAEITQYQDSEGNIVNPDIDSSSNNVILPSDEILPDYKGNTGNKEDLTDENYHYKGQEDDDDFEKIYIKPIDLSLRKFITGVGDRQITDREPQVDITPLINKTGTTAIYNHTKEPIGVKVGDIVTYTIRVYNEGDQDVYAGEIIDHLPPELEFIVDDEINIENGWQLVKDNGEIASGRTIKTTALSKGGILDINDNLTRRLNGALLRAFNGESLDYIDLQVRCRVKLTINNNPIEQGKKLTNIAEISKYQTSEGTEFTQDVDSTINNVQLPKDENLPNYKDSEISSGDRYIPGQEDDDDFEKVVIESFDLALRKFITEVNGVKPDVDRTPIFTTNIDENGNYIYEHTKEPILVQTTDVVTYTIRVYNEGTRAGYASEITDDIPEGLEFLPENETNQEYRWVMINKEGNITENAQEAVEIRTDYLSKEQGEIREPEGEENPNLIKAFTGEEPDYKEVKVAFKVIAPNTSDKVIINTAQISDDEDEEGNEVTDKDSIPGNDNAEEDDQDIDKIKLQYFDLALRKFITKVNEEEIGTRDPIFKIDEEGKYVYEHTKEPVLVQKGNVVTYTIRVYNEGTMSGYAKEIGDDIPEGLEFIPENETNQEYRWEMIDKEGNVTEKVEEAEGIRTDYLSKEQEKEEGSNLIEGFDKEAYERGEIVEPKYKEVKVVFKVTEPNTSDRIVINKAQIIEDEDEKGEEVTDIDSIPGEWNEGEDDQDIEKVKVQYFDLALRKWVTEAIVIEKGKETVTQTGHKPEDDPEQVVKVDLNKKDINEVVVKFRYSIRVYNEGEIAGYAKEIKEHIPEGLKFVAEDNPEWREENGEVVTNALAEKLLKPGEYADVEIVLTWINGQDNLGLKENIAEISKDYNESETPDIDSVPDNEKEGEDDIDDAPVILSLILGSMPMYIGLTTGVIVILGIGIFLIKKYVM